MILLYFLAECDTCLAGMNLVHYILSENYWVDIYMIAAQQLCQSIPSESLKNTVSNKKFEHETIIPFLL